MWWWWAFSSTHVHPFPLCMHVSPIVSQHFSIHKWPFTLAVLCVQSSGFVYSFPKLHPPGRCTSVYYPGGGGMLTFDASELNLRGFHMLIVHVLSSYLIPQLYNLILLQHTIFKQLAASFLSRHQSVETQCWDHVYVYILKSMCKQPCGKLPIKAAPASCTYGRYH